LQTQRTQKFASLHILRISSRHFCLHDGPSANLIAINQPVVNFINILRERFSYEKALRSFSLITVWLVTFLGQNISAKCEHKMLMKLTPWVNLPTFYTHVLCTHIPKAQKIKSSVSLFLCLWGSVHVKASRKMSVKLISHVQDHKSPFLPV